MLNSFPSTCHVRQIISTFAIKSYVHFAAVAVRLVRRPKAPPDGCQSKPCGVSLRCRSAQPAGMLVPSCSPKAGGCCVCSKHKGPYFLLRRARALALKNGQQRVHRRLRRRRAGASSVDGGDARHVAPWVARCKARQHAGLRVRGQRRGQVHSVRGAHAAGRPTPDSPRQRER